MPAEFGPPAVVIPSHETLGALFYSAGKNQEAAEEYLRALAVQPGRSAALLGLARAELARGRAAQARESFRLLADNWSEADAGVDGLQEARAQAAPAKPR